MNVDYKLPMFTYDITFSEVPNEVSFTAYISGCPYHCKNCFWSDISVPNNPLSIYEFLDRLTIYKNDITCACFLGGEWCLGFTEFLKVCKELGLKTCLYTGIETYEEFDQKYHDVIMLLDYIKVGSYQEELGALVSPNTNQKFFELNNGKIIKEIKFYGISK